MRFLQVRPSTGRSRTALWFAVPSQPSHLTRCCGAAGLLKGKTLLRALQSKLQPIRLANQDSLSRPAPLSVKVHTPHMPIATSRIDGPSG